MYVYMHALQRANGQRAARHQERAQRPRAALNYYYTAVGSKRHQGHRRTRGGGRRDTKGTGGHRDTTRTGGHSGGIGRDTKRTGENNGGIGAGRKATGTQHCISECALPTKRPPSGSARLSIVSAMCGRPATPIPVVCVYGLRFRP
jgi:hypothetical protein